MKRSIIVMGIALVSLCGSLLAAADIAPTTSLTVDGSTVRTVFFHPIIVTPERAFKKGNYATQMDNWFVDRYEADKILQSLYAEGYILVSPEDILDFSVKGSPVFKRLSDAFPKDKKPLLISMDDLNYYQYMKTNGCGELLFIDATGKLALQALDKDGNEALYYDAELPQILELFIEEHPDFSWNGARGVIALTGYNGLFGWKTQETKSKAFALNYSGAKEVADRLKAMGWRFASHSYLHAWSSKITIKAFVASEEKWMKEVAPIVGKTSLYVLPFGDAYQNNPKMLAEIEKLGFNVIFGVGPRSKAKVEAAKGYAYFERVPFDGRSMQYAPKNTKPYFDSKLALDPLRIKLLRRKR